LRAALAPKAFVRRDGQWGHLDSALLVPGDLIGLKIGDIIPADCYLCAGGSMDIDQSGLTGESLPVEKFPGETVYSGTTVKRGELEAFVCATGELSEFGKTAKLIQSVESEGNFQKVLGRIAYFLIGLAAVLVTVLVIVQLIRRQDVSQVIVLALILMVASVPIAMPVVCTATMAVGARRLAAESAVVTRLSAIEELAGMTVLCSDKTGTLTQNILTLDTPWTVDPSISGDDILFAAALACKKLDSDAIDTAMLKFCPNKERLNDFEQVEFIPFDPSNRRTQSTVRNTLTGEVFKITKGAPKNVLAMAHNQADIESATQATISEFARRGLRSLGVARTLPGRPDTEWHFMGILSLFDPPRLDTKEVIERALQKGVSVKMITGDHLLIAKETARRLGMGNNILQSKSLHDKDRSLVADLAVQVDGFAEVFPEDKFDIVAMIQEKGHITGMTGDGVNDAPALKKAHVGFAVHGATPAAQGAASVVLSTPGLSVIITAIIRSRKIFQRMSNYAVYRINVSLQLLFFFFCGIVLPVFEGFQLPSILVIVMALLNDFTVMSIAYDKVFPAESPDTWRVWQLAIRASAIAFVCIIGALMMLNFLQTNFYRCASQQNYDCTELNFFGMYRLLPNQIRAAMYLQVSLLLEVTVFIARTTGPFFSRRPGFVLMAAIAIEIAVSTLLAIFWPGQFMHTAAANADADALLGCGGTYAGIIYAWTIIVVLIADVVKVIINRIMHSASMSEQSKVAALQEEVRRLMTTRHKR
jgi:H+-transporting ATPase